MNYKLHLQGLHCDSCKKIAEKRLRKIEGVATVNVDMKDQTVLIQTDRTLSQTEAEDILKDTDYKVTALTEI